MARTLGIKGALNDHDDVMDRRGGCTRWRLSIIVVLDTNLSILGVCAWMGGFVVL